MEYGCGRNKAIRSNARYARALARTIWARLLKRVFDIDLEHCLNRKACAD